LGNTPLSKTFASKTDASAWARDVENRIDRGQTIDPGRKISFAQLLKAYRDHVTHLKGMGRSKAQALDQIEGLLGQRRLVEMKTAAFLRFCEAREAEGAGPATILQDHLSYIGTVLRHGGALVAAEQATATVLTSLEAARRTLRHSGRVAKSDERDRRPTDDEVSSLIDLWSRNPASRSR
jgi:hypothetical protein